MSKDITANPVTVVSRSNPAQFALVVNGMSAEKVAAVHELGFGSLLSIGCTTLIGPIWRTMMQNTDTVQHTVTIHGRTFRLDAFEFGSCMGIHDGGDDIEVGETSDAHAYGHIAESMCDNEGRIQLSLLEDIVGRRPEVDDTFRIGYVLYAMGRILIPSTEDHLCGRLVLPLLETAMIRGKNWASFCVSFLIEAISMQRTLGLDIVGGCMLFLQVMYFDKAGEVLFHTDRTVLPLTAWTDYEVRELTDRVRNYGGFRSPLVFYDRSTRPPMRPRTSSDAGQFGVGIQKSVHEDIFEIKLEFMGLHREIWEVKSGMKRLVPDMSVLSSKIGVIGDGMDNFKKEVADLVKLEIMKYAHDWPRNQKVSSAPFWSPAKGDMFQTGFSVLDATKGLEENMKTDYFGVSKPASDGCEKANPVLSATSSSPSEPPSRPGRRTGKEEMRVPRIVQSPVARALFIRPKPYYHPYVGSSRTERVGHPGTSRGLQRGIAPFNIDTSTLSDDDVSLIKYAFLEGKNLTFEEKRTLLAASWDRSQVLYRDEILCLEPGTCITSCVVNFAVATLNKPGLEDWWLPTYFCEKANAPVAGKSFQEWVEDSRTVCNLERFAGLLDTCRRIFLPLHDNTVGGHWFLVMVDMVKKVAEVWDSLPSMSARRWEIAVTTLRHLDDCLFFEKMRSARKNYSFANFPIIFVEGAPKQPNGFDCGIYLINNMMHLGTSWDDGYNSEEFRARMLLHLLKAPANEMDALTLTEARRAIHDVGEDREGFPNSMSRD